MPDVSRIAVRRIQLDQVTRAGDGGSTSLRPTEPSGERFMFLIVELLTAKKEYLVPDQRGTDSGDRSIVSNSGKCDVANFGADATAYRLNIEWALRVGRIEIGLLWFGHI